MAKALPVAVDVIFVSGEVTLESQTPFDNLVPNKVNTFIDNRIYIKSILLKD